MRNFIGKAILFAAGACLVTLSAVTARADDTEVFNTSASGTSNPNILFILDTSGSMGSAVFETDPYNSATTYDSSYTSSCDPTKIYYERGTTPPNCGKAATRRTPAVPASPSFVATSQKCSAANTALASTGHYGGSGIGDDGIRWLTVSTVVSSVATPVNNARTRTITNTYNNTTITTQVYHVTGTKVGAAAETFGAASPFGSVVTVSNINSASSSSASSWGSTTTTPTGSPPTTTPTSSTTAQYWTSDITVPASTVANTAPTVSNTGSPSSTTATGTWKAGTVSSNSVDGVRTIVPPPPTNPTSTTKKGVTTVVTVYQFTRTTTTTTPYTRLDTQTETTPGASTVQNTAVTYTGTDVECDGDKAAGTTGFGFPAASGSEWTASSSGSYWNSGGLQQYTMYSGNYLNYLHNPPGTNQGSRISVMKTAMTNLINSMSGVNVGLMRYSDNSDTGSGDTVAQGGMVTFPLTALSATSKTNLVNTLNTYSANGYTPLSETLFEAFRYYSGGNVYFGNTSKVCSGGTCTLTPSVAASRVGNSLSSNTYSTPITSACQNNYVVYLTDGLPTQDNEADSLIQGLPNFARDGGSCDDDTKAPYGSGWGPGNSAGKCLSALTQYMNHHDMNGSITGNQGVVSYFVGFGDDFLDSNGQLGTAFDYLTNAATRGGGTAYSAVNATQLQTVLSAIVADAMTRNTSFSAPTVAVNAFNRTTNLSDLYISVFQPSGLMHWPGNVKKYHLTNNVLVDQSNNPAVDPATGFFYHSSKSFWTQGDPDGAWTALTNGSPDGESVPAGGAAHRLPGPGSRNIYTYISGTTHPSSPVDLTASINTKVDTGNTLLTNSQLGAPGTTTAAQLASLINWIKGQDIDDSTDPANPAGDNPNGSQTDARYVMGDPIHARPAVVIYGGTATNPDQVVYVPTNDGYLHAIAGADNDGFELWSFIPQDVLPDMNALHTNAATGTKHYALDGDATIIKYDENGNGIVDGSNDRVILVVGQGRGGSHYYALDVTDKNKPKFMWSTNSSDLPGIGQTWSSPVLARVKVNSSNQTSNQKFVLIFGGGYDSVEETAGWHATDTLGSKIFMIDPLTGKTIWSAGSSGADLTLARMDHSIPGSISVIDTDGDGYADRMYAADLAGQVWRFDIDNSGVSPSSLVTGGVIASLGAHDAGSHSTDTDNRRFFNGPDVALITSVGASPYFAVSLGSGYRSHPLNNNTVDRFYSIRDKKPYTRLTQSQYNALTILTDADMTDITTNLTPQLDPTTTKGWKLTLSAGEKALSGSTTFQGTLLFTTYQTGGSTSSSNGCTTSSTGVNRAYAVNVVDGSPVKQHGQDYSHDCSAGNCTAVDRSDDLAQGGIAPGVVVLFYSSGSSNSSSSSSSSSGGPPSNSCVGTNPTFIVGPEVIFAPHGCTRFKTYWKSN